MTKTDRTEPESGDAPTANPGAVRRTRAIRFSDSEWEEVKATAELQDLPAAEQEDSRHRLQPRDTGQRGPDLAHIADRTDVPLYMVLATHPTRRTDP